MIVFAIMCAVVIALLLVLCYALFAISAEADAKAEKMYKEWRNGTNKTR